MVKRIIRFGITLALAAVSGAGVAMAAPNPETAPATTTAAEASETVTQPVKPDASATADDGDRSLEDSVVQPLTTDKETARGKKGKKSKADQARAETGVLQNDEKATDEAAAVMPLEGSFQERAEPPVTDAPGPAAPAMATPVPVSVVKPTLVPAAKPVVRRLSKAMAQPLLAVAMATTPPVAVAAEPARPKPTPVPTQPFSGFLQQFRTLLADTFLPASAVLWIPADDFGQATALALAVPALLLTVVFQQVLLIPLVSYAERLRRSGYLGAPRSDIAAFMLFATPQKWVLSAVPVRR